jgi:hypothetical protein
MRPLRTTKGRFPMRFTDEATATRRLPVLLHRSTPRADFGFLLLAARFGRVVPSAVDLHGWLRGTRTWLVASALLGGLTLGSPSHAAEGGPDPAESRASEPDPAPAPARQIDAHADRVILMPTAETHPQGSFFFSSYELVLLQVGYAITDHVQFSTLILPPLFDEQPFFMSPTVKVNVARGDVGNVALLGGVDLLASGGSDSDSALLGRLGVVAQLCLANGCRSSISVNVLGWTAFTNEAGSALVASAGGVFRVSDVFALLLEPTLGVPLAGDVVDDDTPAGLALSYGFRLSGASFALDLTFIRPFFGDLDDDLALGLPFVVATYRAL